MGNGIMSSFLGRQFYRSTLYYSHILAVYFIVCIKLSSMFSFLGSLHIKKIIIFFIIIIIIWNYWRLVVDGFK